MICRYHVIKLQLRLKISFDKNNPIKASKVQSHKDEFTIQSAVILSLFYNVYRFHMKVINLWLILRFN